MLAFVLCVRSSWDDYYSVGSYPISKTYTSRQTFSGTYVYISNCLFRSIVSSSNGGALHCTSLTYLLIELTSFFSCKTSTNCGGAIYFYNTNNGQCVLHEVCGNDCYTTYTSGSNSQFCRIEVSTSVSSKNYVNYSSIVRCANEISNTWQMMCQINGKQCYPSVNISMNKCFGRAGIHFQPSSDSTSVTCLMTHSSLADNNSTGYNCVSLWIEAAKYEFNSCNIIRNTQVYLNSEGTIYTYGNLKIENSCILENKATYIFYAVSPCTVTLSNCTVDNTAKTGNFVLQNTITKSFILALDHMSTRDCHSGYDAVGTLTPIVQHTSSKNQIYLCTCRNFFNQPLLSDIVSLLNILIFNFIHPYASIDFL
jgi:hypothetical protein